MASTIRSQPGWARSNLPLDLQAVQLKALQRSGGNIHLTSRLKPWLCILFVDDCAHCHSSVAVDQL
jgi:hypothetical protein